MVNRYDIWDGGVLSDPEPDGCLVRYEDYEALKMGRDAFERACNENAQVVIDQQGRIAALEAKIREISECPYCCQWHGQQAEDLLASEGK